MQMYSLKLMIYNRLSVNVTVLDFIILSAEYHARTKM